ncbi:putative 6,7-dimethyl-8-ribityllumazine synthase [Candidatus Ichthyocystis hellenicum]|uniref:6,7-dimethyl-8-ribityllumazine synthase n=2 Tax=Burkholderiales genera incertae sedis TaxID=224471 RepID=A0A0S4M7L0_9BURK|nr:6,7-dimethyl-8-ribityllumazine synthase [Candidatus Ichthyocystis hellenicum]CUT17380.1 putative 6,7-dimethyl-8-ribityllumazine synthase [Candidatus Ichthyocystis hellenicum]
MSERNFIRAEVPFDVSDLNLVVGVVTSRFNSDITLPLRDKCVDRLLSRGVSTSCLVHADVPGSLEISYALSLIAARQFPLDVMVAIGCVIRGDTFHFDVVAMQSSSSIYRVQEAQGVPVVNGILTTDNFQQASDRISRGDDFADCAIEMAFLRRFFSS